MTKAQEAELRSLIKQMHAILTRVSALTDPDVERMRQENTEATNRRIQGLVQSRDPPFTASEADKPPKPL